jgi:hypothetical protein
MSWNQIYRNMAFCPYKDDLAAARELHDSLMTLRLYLDGQSRPFEVLDALRHLEYVCGQPVKGLQHSSGAACPGMRRAHGTRSRGNA